MAEKFLILGANSFYGNAFAQLLQDRGEQIELLSRGQCNIDSRAGKWAKASAHPRDSWVWLEESLSRADYVVNFISKSLVAESWLNPEAWARTNLESTTMLFDAVRAHKIKKFIHVSTPEVYGSVDAWVNEEQRFNPSTPYAVSRAAGDMMLKAYYRAYDFPMVITRTANIYGPGQPDHRIVTRAIRCKKEGKTLMLDGGGNSIRCFIHVRDACEATYLVARSGKSGETYHISGWSPISIRGLVDIIGTKWHQSPERLGKDYAYKMDSTKIRKLGWMDKISLEEGLKECESSL